MNIQPKNEKVDQIFTQYNAPGSPGCSLGVFKDGEIICKQGYGLADLEHQVPFLPTSVFNIGSTAKQFTGFGIALLESQDHLSIDDDIHKHLPEMHDFGSEITLGNLLFHTSGIRCTFPDLLGFAEYWESDLVTQVDVFRLLKAQRELDFPPGTEFGYANSNYILLALICERVSGMPFERFCKEQIFDPLGMSETVVFHDPMMIIEDKACAYYDEGEGAWSNSVLVDSVMGPTNVYTTVEDLAKWDQNFYTGTVGGKNVIERMQTPGYLEDGTELEYAYGLEVGPGHTHRGWQLIEHGGGHGAYCNHMLRIPELHLSVVVLFNHFLWNSRDFALKVADLFLQDNPNFVGEQGDPLHKKTINPLGMGTLEKYVGKYFNPNRAALRTVSIGSDNLNYEGLKLLPLSDKRFYLEEVPDVEVEFRKDEFGKTTGVTTFTSEGDYSYDIVEIAQLGINDLIAYQGRYYSPELDVFWNIEQDGSQLVVHRRKYPDSRMSPLFQDAFSDDWSPISGYPRTLMVIFDRDDRGNINGLKVSGDRVRNLRFRKE